MLINALNGKKLPLYGDGKNVRDWLYVEDHCRALELVLERGASAKPTTLAVAMSVVTSRSSHRFAV